MNYVAKVELFEHRWQGWILSRLGAFPIRRGESDEDSMETARQIVERGGTVCIFPEGTRIRTGSLVRPRRGVGRLALQTGAPVIPTAVIGTEHVRRGWRIRPRKVKVRLGKAMTFPRAEEPSKALAETVTARIWPNVQLQWEDLGGLPPLRRAAVIGAGSWGTAVAVLLARGGLEVQLGARTPERVAELLEDRENRRYLPDVQLPESIDVRLGSEIELDGLDLICLAIPSKSLPQAVGAIADRVGGRSSILLMTKGLIAAASARDDAENLTRGFLLDRADGFDDAPVVDVRDHRVTSFRRRRRLRTSHRHRRSRRRNQTRKSPMTLKPGSSTGPIP